MASTLKRLAGPAYIANSATDIFNASSSLLYSIVNQVRVSNKTGGAVTYTLYLGASGGSAGGTEVTGLSETIPANSHVDHYFGLGLKMLSTDFLSGIASAANSLVVVVMGQQGAV